MMNLFEQHEQQPKELQDILSKYNLDELTYEGCKQMLSDVEAVGYTFEYGLDAQPYALTKKIEIMEKFEITIWKFKDELHKGTYELKNQEEARTYALGIFKGLDIAGKGPTGLDTDKL